MNTGTASPCKAYGMQWNLNIGLKLKSLDHANHSVCSCSCCTPPWPEGLEKSLMALLVPYKDVLPLNKHTNDQTLCKGVNGSSVSTLSAEISSVIAMCTGTDTVSFPEKVPLQEGKDVGTPPPPLSLPLSLILSLCVSFPLSLTSPLSLAQLFFPRSLPFPHALHLPGAEMTWVPFLSLLPCPRKGARRKVKATVVPLIHGQTELNKEMDKGVWEMALNTSANAMQSQTTTMCPVCQ